ncbi:MAG: hypothetical protein WAN03_08565 [Candidatus Sulfotelmatobacter sp.]
MRNSLMLFTLVTTILPAGLHAQAKPASHMATVVSVTKYEAPSNYVGSPTDAPLQPTEYADDIDIRLGCEVYVGRYKSAIDCLPSTFRAGHPAEISVEKHTIYVRDLSAADVKLNLVRSYRSSGAACPSGPATSPGA